MPVDIQMESVGRRTSLEFRAEAWAGVSVEAIHLETAARPGGW